ncbi:hypothetical protein E2562_037283 [Oryza meyeriana var. granulata]|uniref:Retrotransposon Copia-like N-terminal domain-containing protein n=1 Tax=Oryza meyeriana var. granulata TaxID=110450 RepID=A0A6G1E7Q2_9ORYZ|nr:hypothetical protein E2562_037283 [Oryza meyeriana var. granulata]
MAALSSSSGSGNTNPFLGHPMLEKLEKANFALWKGQISAMVRGARLQGYLTGTVQVPEAEVSTIIDGKVVKKPNLAYEDWEAVDQ